MSAIESTGAPHPVRRKSLEEVAREWDEAGPVRSDQIVRGVDPTFSHLLAPLVEHLLAQHMQTGMVLDVGCGTGALTRRLADRFGRAVGVDPSTGSIRRAARDYEVRGRCEFVVGTARSAAESGQPIGGAVANMVLMDAPDLGELLREVADVVPQGCPLVWTVTHPWFWPSYWGYADEEWFDYSKEIFIEGRLRISAETTSVSTTHVHRPLEQYLREFARSGWRLVELLEPMPSADVERLYRERWAFPRYLAGVLVKASSS